MLVIPSAARNLVSRSISGIHVTWEEHSPSNMQRLLERRLRVGSSADLHQRPGASPRRHRGVVVHIGIVVLVEDRRAHSRRKPAQRAEGVVHRAGFVATMYHAIRALGIAALGAVLLPLRFLPQ